MTFTILRYTGSTVAADTGYAGTTAKAGPTRFSGEVVARTVARHQAEPQTRHPQMTDRPRLSRKGFDTSVRGRREHGAMIKSLPLRGGLIFLAIRTAMIIVVVLARRSQPEADMVAYLDFPTIGTAMALDAVGISLDFENASDPVFNGLGSFLWFAIGCVAGWGFCCVRRWWSTSHS